jgi:hypothetical protein
MMASRILRLDVTALARVLGRLSGCSAGLIGLADSGADLRRGVGQAGVVHPMMTRSPAEQGRMSIPGWSGT